jgi:high-affinity K+ transport system ATPase subunit B
MATKISIWDWGIIKFAMRDAILKLSPRHQIRNPVMFTVYIGSLLTTGLFLFFLSPYGYGLQSCLLISQKPWQKVEAKLKHRH